MRPRRLIATLSSWLSLIVVGMGLAMGLASYWMGRSAVEKIAGDLFREVSRRGVLRTRGQLDAAAATADAVAALVGGELAGASPERLAHAFLGILAANSGFTWVSYSDASGAFTGVYRAEGELRVNTSRLVGGKSPATEYTVQPDGSWKVRSNQEDSHYDPRVRPFYQLVEERRRRSWTEPYVFFNQGIPGITCAAPVFDKGGKLSGVVTIDFDLNSLSEFAAKAGADLGPHATVFIFTVNGTLLAHSRLRVVNQGAGEQGTLITAANVDDPGVKAYLAEALRKHPADEHSQEGLRERDESFSLSYGGEPWLASYDSFEVDVGRLWVVGAMAPARDFLGGVRRIALISGLVTALVVAVALLLAGILARRISRPMVALAAEMERVGGFYLDGGTVQSPIEEVQRMSAALSAMRSGLASFARFVPRDLVREVLKSRHEATLGGETREMTVLFTDIAGFTSIAEAMEPAALVKLLGVYLDEMTQVIARHGGTVDKFIGDGIMAFWNAPARDGEHAARACLAALACRRRQEEMVQAPGADPALAKLETRIGIASGEALVGNIGTPERLNYTVMGDVVNLASRLEGLSKVYGTHLLIAEETFREAKGKIVARPIDVVAVKGKAKGVKVYEPLCGFAEKDDPARLVASLSEDAVIFYLARDFAGAIGRWEQVLQIRPGDKAAQVMRDRARGYRESPPPPGWSGVHAMTEK